MEEDIEIKILNDDSFDDIIHIQKNDASKHVYYLDKQRLRDLSKRGEVFYGIYQGDDLVGFAGIDIEIRAKLHFLSICEKHQRKGYATRLIGKLIQDLKSQKIKQLFFYVEKDSPHEPFLKVQGFEKIGFYTNRFGDGWDADIFELAIH